MSSAPRSRQERRRVTGRVRGVELVLGVELNHRHAIRVNDQHRITFRWEGHDAFDVRCDKSH